MRVLSFIPALLLAACSFVAAAPTIPDSSSAAVAPCVPSTGNDAPVQPYIHIIHKATSGLQPLSDKLIAAKSGTADAGAVAEIVVEITGVIKVAVAEIKAVAVVDLEGLELANLGVSIYLFLNLVVVVLGAVVQIVLSIGVVAAASLLVSVSALLQAVASLVVVLKFAVYGSLALVLGPVLVLVTSISQTLVIILGLKIVI